MTVTAPSSSARPSSNNVAVGVGVGVGVSVSVALLAGLTYLVRRRSNNSHGQDGTAACLDNTEESNVNQRVVHQVPEIEGGSRTVEPSGQNLVELQHPASR